MTSRAPTLLVALLLVAAPGLVLGANDSLGGSWRIDIERSDPYGQGQQARPLPEIDLTVTLFGDNVGIDQHFASGVQQATASFTYVTDGKPHEVQAVLGTRSARARWKKDKLAVSYTMRRQTQAGTFDLDVSETWSVSDDGQELTIIYVTRAAQRSFNRKEIYVRD